MILDMLISAFGQGFIYAPMALGVFISFGILKTPDLSVEGSFVFGMTVCAQTAILGHPVAGLFAGMFAGALAGACTGLLQTKLKIEAILSLSSLAVYSVPASILMAGITTLSSLRIRLSQSSMMALARFASAYCVRPSVRMT